MNWICLVVHVVCIYSLILSGISAWGNSNRMFLLVMRWVIVLRADQRGKWRFGRSGTNCMPWRHFQVLGHWLLPFFFNFWRNMWTLSPIFSNCNAININNLALSFCSFMWALLSIIQKKKRKLNFYKYIFIKCIHSSSSFLLVSPHENNYCEHKP